MKKIEIFMHAWPLLYLIQFYNDRSTLKLGSSTNIFRIFEDTKRYSSNSYELISLILLDPELTPANIKISENLLSKFLKDEGFKYTNNFLPKGSHQSCGGTEFILSTALPVIRNYCLPKKDLYFTDSVSEICLIMDQHKFLEAKKRKTFPAYNKYRVQSNKIFLSYMDCATSLDIFLIGFKRIVEPYVLLDFILLQEDTLHNNILTSNIHIFFKTEKMFNLLPTAFNLTLKNLLGVTLIVSPNILTGENKQIQEYLLLLKKNNTKKILSINYESLIKNK